ncbi:hypothetical protein SLE2022_080580 [Rubroshorea leprosula]
MVPAGGKAPDLPPHSPVSFDQQRHAAAALFLIQQDGVEGSDGYVCAADKRRPDIDFVGALERRRDCSGEGDLLAVVGGVNVELVVVDAGSVVGIAGFDGDLKIGGEEVGSGGVEDGDSDVLEDEGEDLAKEFLALTAVLVVAVLDIRRHGNRTVGSIEFWKLGGLKG